MADKPLDRRPAGIWCEECKEFVSPKYPCEVSCKTPIFSATLESIQKEHDDCKQCDSSLQRSSEFTFWNSMCPSHQTTYLVFLKTFSREELRKYSLRGMLPPEALLSEPKEGSDLDLGPPLPMKRQIATGTNSVEK